MKGLKKKYIAAIAMVAISPVTSVMAWGPERPTYTMEKPASAATFNSITDNPELGDERNFVRIAEKGASGVFGDEITIEPGKEYEVYIGYHNDAATNTNDTGVGIAQQVRLASTFPATVKSGDRVTVAAVISASNTNPKKVWDEAYMTAAKDVKLSYVSGSAKIYNGWAINGSVLPSSLFTEEGTYLGVGKLDGIVYGCAEYSGHVIYTIKADGEEVPEVPEVPAELPHTGPAEIAMAIAIVLGICGGSFYLYRSKKALQKATDSINGGNIDPKDLDDESEKDEK